MLFVGLLQRNLRRAIVMENTKEKKWTGKKERRNLLIIRVVIVRNVAKKNTGRLFASGVKKNVPDVARNMIASPTRIGGRGLFPCRYHEK